MRQPPAGIEDRMTDKIIDQTGRSLEQAPKASRSRGTDSHLNRRPPASPKQPPGCLGGPLGIPPRCAGDPTRRGREPRTFGLASRTQNIQKPPVHQVVQGTPLSPHDLSVVGAARLPLHQVGGFSSAEDRVASLLESQVNVAASRLRDSNGGGTHEGTALKTGELERRLRVPG